VRKFGGVLEHPSGSLLFGSILPLPGSYDRFGGFSISVDQFWFGHQARKRTYLYIYGCSIKDVPGHPLRFDAIQYGVGASNYKKGLYLKDISRKKREETPIDFAKYLISIAAKCSV